MSKLSSIGILGILSAMAYDYNKETSLSDDERKQRGNEMMKKNYKSEKEIAEAKGLNEFDYNGVKIYALNQKNADKKAKKQGLI